MTGILFPCADRRLPRRRDAAALRAAASLGVMLLSLAAGGCAGGDGSPAVATAVDQWPDDRYVTASATSTASFEDAEMRARQAVAARIRSTLESELRSRSETRIDAAGERSETVTNRFLSQQVAFSHAELIRVDHQSRREDDGVYHVVAYLPRQDAGRILRRDYDAAAAAMQRHADALEAVPPGDLPGFAAAYGETRRQWQAVHRSAMELWVIAGNPPVSFRQDQARWNAVEDRRLELIAGVPMAFSLLEPRPAGDTLDAARLRQEFLEALTEAGLSIRGDRCDGDGYLIEFQPRLHYRGVIGVICRLDFAGRLIDCATGDAWDLHLEDEAFLGEGANTWAARKGAADRVTADALAPLLIEALGSSLPLN